MPYVERDENGIVKGIYAAEQAYASEYLADTHADVKAYAAKSELISARNMAKRRVMDRKLAELCAADFTKIDAAKTASECDAI